MLRENSYRFKKLILLHGFVIISLASSCIIIIYSNFATAIWNTLEPLVIFIGSICDILRGVFIVLQCLTQTHLIIEMISMFRKLEIYFSIQLRHRLSYDSFQKKYFYKSLIIMTCYMQYLVVYIIRNLFRQYLTPIGIQLRCLQALLLLTILYVIFYIDLLSFNLNELNVVIERDMTQINMDMNRDSATSILIRNRIKCYKSVHFRLWKIAQAFNSFFGWIMIAMLLHIFSDSVYAAFWLFKELQVQTSYTQIIRT